MNFSELAKGRHSCRNYKNQPVDKEKLMEMVQIATSSPSACNSQPWHLVIVNDKEKIEKMTSALQIHGINKFTDNVPSYIVICETKAQLMPGATCDSQYYAQMDIGLIVAHLVLYAQEQGLATCIMGSFKEDTITKLLSIPKEAKIRLVLAVGYAQDDTIKEKSRKDFDSVCGLNQW